MQNWDREDYGHIPTPLNVTEKAVRRVLFEYLDRGELECCACESCLVNVQAIALNKLRGWHIRGDLLMQEDDWPTLMNAAFPTRTDVERAVLEAAARVQQFPKKVAHGERLILPW
ncbi:MAG: late competence development ComFB family protein [Planctomycetota bacterium]